jgi:chaperone modulatory protein CbpM
MITLEALIARYPALEQGDLERWVSHDWVRADQETGTYVFQEIDVARIELILRLRDDMDVNEDALPIVLSLLDQLFDARRRMRELDEALARVAPDAVRRELASFLATRTG